MQAVRQIAQRRLTTYGILTVLLACILLIISWYVLDLPRHTFARKQDSARNSMWGRTVLERQRSLQGTLQSFCNTQYNRSQRWAINPKRYIVDEKHQVLMCVIPKVASTVWKMGFSVLNGNLTIEELRWMLATPDFRETTALYIHRSKSYRRLAYYPQSQQDIMLRDYFKALFVRDPLRRLVSVYTDKFVQQIERTANRVSNIYPLLTYEQRRFKNVTFVDFLQLVMLQVHHSANMAHVLGHWKTYLSICNPCVISYDFIGQLEHFEEDANYLLREKFRSPYPAQLLLHSFDKPIHVALRNHGDFVDTPLLENSSFKDDDLPLYDTLYRQVPRQLLDDVREYVRDDGRAFGYDIWRKLN